MYAVKSTYLVMCIYNLLKYIYSHTTLQSDQTNKHAFGFIPPKPVNYIIYYLTPLSHVMYPNIKERFQSYYYYLFCAITRS